MKLPQTALVFALVLTHATPTKSIPPIDTIPSELKELMLSNSSIRNILNFCNASKTQQPLCDNADSPLWKELVIRDFGPAFSEAKETFATWTELSWKDFYINLTKRQRAPLAASHNTVVLDGSGEVWIFGEGEKGRSFQDTKLASSMPRKLEGLPKMVSVAAGHRHTVLLDFRGGVWTFGWGEKGQLGHGNRLEQRHAKKIENLEVKIVSIAAGYNGTVLLDTNGNVWTFGENVEGELGSTDIDNDQLTPKMIEGLPTRIVYIAASTSHTVLLDTKGDVWTFGRGILGQLGHGQPESEDFKNHFVPKRIAHLPATIVAITAGAAHTALLDAFNNVWAFGDANFGQLGENRKSYESVPKKIENLPAKITFVAAGCYHTVFLLADKKMWTVGPTDSRLTNLLNEVKVPREVSGLQGIVAVATRSNHTVALDKELKVWTYGFGQFGQLGHKKTTDEPIPKRVKRMVWK